MWANDITSALGSKFSDEGDKPFDRAGIFLDLYFTDWKYSSFDGTAMGKEEQILPMEDIFLSSLYDFLTF